MKHAIFIVDKSAEVTDGKVVIAIVYGEFTVKTLKRRNGNAFLVPANANYPEIELTPEMECEVRGVVTSVMWKDRGAAFQDRHTDHEGKAPLIRAAMPWD